MVTDNPRSTISIAGHPLHAMLVPIPIACFVLTLVFDIAYWKTADMQWANFSVWLLFIGLVVGALAALAGIIDLMFERRIRALAQARIHGAGNVLVLILSAINAMVHSRDAFNSVVPLGISLSVIVVLILIVTGWNGWAMVYRHRVGVRGETGR